MCTLHSFPHNIDHCLTFARSEFEGLLEKSPAEANAFLANPAKYLEIVRQVGQHLNGNPEKCNEHQARLRNMTLRPSCLHVWHVEWLL